MKKMFAITIVICLCLGTFSACIGGGSGVGGPGQDLPLSEPNTPAEISSYDDVTAYLNSAGSTNSAGTRAEFAATSDSAGGMGAPVPNPVPAVDQGLKAESAVPVADYSGTNVQVEGIDEADVVKTDGEYIYILQNGTELIIAKAVGKDTSIISRTKIASSEYSDTFGRDEYVSNMYLAGDRIVLLKTEQHWLKTAASYSNGQHVYAEIYDVSEPASPNLVKSLGQDGNITDSRLYAGILYVISNYYIYNWSDDDPITYIPRTYNDGAEKLIAVPDIFIPNNVSSTSWTIVTSCDVSSGEQLSSVTVLGGAGTVYMNGSNLYIASATWKSDMSEPYTSDQYSVVDYRESSVTDIMRFSTEGGTVLFETTGSVPGYLIDQFAMDEYNGFLRIVTTNNGSSYKIFTDEKYGFTHYQWGENTSSSGLYILDQDLKRAGGIDGLGEDESVYSVRFNGDICYFVTFRRTDPLFAVDVSDPTAPTVLSALKIPGFSEYLHVYGDGLLFGLGMSADEETGRTQALKLSMFDTSNPADVSEKSTQVLDNVYYSPALYDHHAAFINVEKNIIGFAAENNYLFYSYSDGRFIQLASVSLSGYGNTTRGLYIGDYIYICDMEGIHVLGLSDFAQAAFVRF